MLWEVDNDCDVYCVIFKGVGRVFSVGYDFFGVGSDVLVFFVELFEGNYCGC